MTLQAQIMCQNCTHVVYQLDRSRRGMRGYRRGGNVSKRVLGDWKSSHQMLLYLPMNQGNGIVIHKLILHSDPITSNKPIVTPSIMNYRIYVRSCIKRKKNKHVQIWIWCSGRWWQEDTVLHRSNFMGSVPSCVQFSLKPCKAQSQSYDSNGPVFPCLSQTSSGFPFPRHGVSIRSEFGHNHQHFSWMAGDHEYAAQVLNHVAIQGNFKWEYATGI